MWRVSITKKNRFSLSLSVWSDILYVLLELLVCESETARIQQKKPTTAELHKTKFQIFFAGNPNFYEETLGDSRQSPNLEQSQPYQAKKAALQSKIIPNLECQTPQTTQIIFPGLLCLWDPLKRAFGQNKASVSFFNFEHCYFNIKFTTSSYVWELFLLSFLLIFYFNFCWKGPKESKAQWLPASPVQFLSPISGREANAKTASLPK